MVRRTKSTVGQLSAEEIDSFGAEATDLDREIFSTYAGSSGLADPKRLLDLLASAGILPEDERILDLVALLQQMPEGAGIDLERFQRLRAQFIVFDKVVTGDMVVTDFPSFAGTIASIFDAASTATSGTVADYIPALAVVEPEQWGTSVCTIDGQRTSFGDAHTRTCIQSTSKPLTYAMALELHGHDFVHRHVGFEPSGRNFNERVLKKPTDVPHNPVINAGAIMAASMVKLGEATWDRHGYVVDVWERLCGSAVGFQYECFTGERATASRNFCLAYMMEEAGAFPEGTDVIKALEAYFEYCSLELTCEQMAVVAATLANGGQNPLTGERVFEPATVTSALSIMLSCGMYDYSGEFAFSVGLPTKSGVSGLLCIVKPGLAGFATWSPRLDACGNSTRGIKFCMQLTSQLCLHVVGPANRPRTGLTDAEASVAMFWACAQGDETRLRQLAACSAAVNTMDYDRRTPIHVAASHGYDACLRLILILKADLDARDNWNNTALDDAVRNSNAGVQKTIEYVKKHGGGMLEPTYKEGDPLRFFNFFIGKGVPARQASGISRVVVAKTHLVEAVEDCGLCVTDDPRCAGPLAQLPDPFDAEDLARLVESAPVLGHSLEGRLAVPNFPGFIQHIADLFEVPDGLLSLTTVDGQALQYGQPDETFALESLGSTVLLAMALESFGADKVMAYCGKEPSGQGERECVFNSDHLPYNPFMWTGFINVCALLLQNGEAGRTPEAVLEDVCNVWRELSNQSHVAVNGTMYAQLLKKDTFKARAIVNTLCDSDCFPKGVAPADALLVFFAVRALETTVQDASVFAATLANGGRNPYSGREVLAGEYVRDILTLMLLSGAGAQSGELAFKVGAPVKSARTGALLMVVPEQFGCCVFSSELNDFEVSKGGADFFFRFGGMFNIHRLQDSRSAHKLCCTGHSFSTAEVRCGKLLHCAAGGDLQGIRHLHHGGLDLNAADYDVRTAAHVAAGKGHASVLRYLERNGADMQAVDGWMQTPRDDALKNRQFEVAAMLPAAERGVLTPPRSS